MSSSDSEYPLSSSSCATSDHALVEWISSTKSGQQHMTMPAATAETVSGAAPSGVESIHHTKPRKSRLHRILPLADDDAGALLAQNTPLFGLGAVATTLLPAEEAKDTARSLLAVADGICVRGQGGVLPGKV